jgi:N4-gp56 family major capsid protein
MATTTKANMIIPAVWADMVAAEFTGRMVLGQLATTDNTLVGKPGDTVHFPKFATLTDATDLTEATAMTPEALTTTDSTATIKEVGKAVEISDTALVTAYGDPLAEIRRQLGVVVARKIDTDLKTVAETTPNYSATAAAVISWSNIVDGIAKFGDAWDPADMAGIVIHSKQHADLLKDASFITRDKLAEAATIATGVVGRVGGVDVYVSDRTTIVTGTPNTYKALLVKRGALGLLYKRQPLVETDRDILKRTQVITTNVHYAVKRLNDNGVCVLTTQ